MAIDMPYQVGRELPRFTLRQEDLPELVQWEVGGKYYLVVKVEQTGITNMKGTGVARDEERKLEATFQVLNVKALGNDDVNANDMERQEFGQMYAKAMSGEFLEDGVIS